MSSDLAEEYAAGEEKVYVECVVCGGHFVEGGLKLELPAQVCVWCWSRGPLISRFFRLYDALALACSTHPDPCACSPCADLAAAAALIEPARARGTIPAV